MTIRVGVVGTGAAALTGHLPALAASARFELVGVADTEPTHVDEAARRFGVGERFASAASLVEAVEPDAVVIATPPQSHLPLGEELLRRGVHVLMEKPLARSLEECRALVDAARAGGATLAVGHEKRFHHTLRRVGELLAEGAVGEPFHVGVHWASNAKLDPDALVPAGFRHGYEWRWRDPTVGGGLVQDHLPHYVDLLRHWTGREPVEVYAHARNVARDVLGWPEEESRWDDFALAIVRFDDPLELRFETSVVGRSISPIWALGSGVGEWTEYAYVLGSAGQLVVDLLPWDSSEHGRIALWQLDAARGGRGWTWLEQVEPPRRAGGAGPAMFAAQAESWADLIEGRPAAIATGEDGAVALAAVEAAYRSAAERAAVAVAVRVQSEVEAWPSRI
jgi:predicted dehydrogenase